MADKPIRLQLSRAKGFNLQEHSREINGLEAVNVARSSQWGNPFPVSRYGRDGAVSRFRRHIEGMADEPGVRESLRNLRGKNLACWCKPGEACHADILLEIANGGDHERR